MKLTVLTTLLASATALKSQSATGQNLMSKSRGLDENQNSWMINYSLVFASCHSVANFNEGNGDEGAVTVQNLVKYKLCPTNKCHSGCSGAEYLVDMDEFVNSYTEWQMDSTERMCEDIRESCGCGEGDDDGDDDEEACEATCYTDKGVYDKCVEQDGDDDSYVFELQEWLECKEMDYEGQAYYDQYGEQIKYYVGPTCSSNGQRINLGIFTDEMCTQVYEKTDLFKTTYGVSLPYTKANIVAENCISCKIEDANNQYYDEDPEMTEICEESYDAAAKCESKIAKKITYPVTTDCEYINNIAQHEVGYSAISSGAAVGFAIFFGITAAAMTGVAAKLFMDTKTRTIDLHGNDAAVV